MKKSESPISQLIPGNPGTSYIACLIFTLNTKYAANISNDEQLKIFCDGMNQSRKTFFAKTLNIISKEFKHDIKAYVSNNVLLRLAKEEAEDNTTTYEPLLISRENILKLIAQYQYITISTDIYYFNNHSYHDYHFCCFFMDDNVLRVFEPSSGSVRTITRKDLDEIIDSVTKELKDSTLVFCL
jgi:hypothetical protein